MTWHRFPMLLVILSRLALVVAMAFAAACAPTGLRDPATRARADEVVERVRRGKLDVPPGEMDVLVRLPHEYADLSATGQVAVTMVDDLVVAFFVSAKGTQPNPYPAYVYDSSGRYQVGDPTLWVIERLDDRWFYVEERT